MEQNRTPLPTEEINAAMEKYRSLKRYNKEQLDLIKEDLEFGLTTEEVEMYSNKKDFRKMKVVSRCLRAGFSKEIYDFICSNGLNAEQMESYYGICIEGATLYQLEQIKDLVGNSSHQIKKAYDTLNNAVDKALEERKKEEVAQEPIEQPETEESNPHEVEESKETQKQESQSHEEKQEYTSRLVSDIKEFIQKELKTVKDDEEIRQRLVNQIAEKDSDLSAKQDELNIAIGKVQTLSKENEELKNEMELIKKELEERKAAALKVTDTKESEPNKEKSDESSTSGTTKVAPEDKQENVEERDENMSNTIPIGVRGYGVALPVYYQIPVIDKHGRTVMDVTVGKDERKSSGIFGVMSKLLFKKKSRADIVKLVANGDLVPAQLIQIKNAIERGLTEGQLVELINNNLSPDKMKEIIEIAVLENSILC